MFFDKEKIKWQIVTDLLAWHRHKNTPRMHDPGTIDPSPLSQIGFAAHHWKEYLPEEWAIPGSISQGEGEYQYIRDTHSETSQYEEAIAEAFQELGSVRKLVLPYSGQPSTMKYTEIHIEEARYLDSASFDRP